MNLCTVKMYHNVKNVVCRTFNTGNSDKKMTAALTAKS